MGKNNNPKYKSWGFWYIQMFLLLVMFFSGCSSAPKRAAEIFTDRDTAQSQLNLANKTANRGRYNEALAILEEARRLAVSADDPSLRIKTSISRGNLMLSLGHEAQAFAEWENAAAEGDASAETALAALARICAIRAKLLLMANGQTGAAASEGEGQAEQLKIQLGEEMLAVRADDFSTASGYVTLGLAEKQLGRWAEAESAVRRALDVHEKNRSLEDAAYDWFLIASIRSVAGNLDSALEALRTAISFDRRAENSFGLASSWQAMGDVYQKAGRNEESKTAWRRASEIYHAMGLGDRARKLDGDL